MFYCHSITIVPPLPSFAQPLTIPTAPSIPTQLSMSMETSILKSSQDTSESRELKPHFEMFAWGIGITTQTFTTVGSNFHEYKR